MTRGYLLIDNTRSREEGRPASGVLAGLAACIAVGAMAGVLVTQCRLPLGLPGHKVVLWLAPVILARLLARTSVGATAGSLAAAAAAMMCGGPLGGGIGYWPAAGPAGALLDATIAMTERRRPGAAWTVALVGVAAMGANLIMLGGRMLTPMHRFHAFLGISGPAADVVSYAVFGLAAGLAAAAAAMAVRRTTRM